MMAARNRGEASGAPSCPSRARDEMQADPFVRASLHLTLSSVCPSLVSAVQLLSFSAPRARASGAVFSRPTRVHP